MVDFSLKGKIALVTGASYGIGFAIASAYAEAGATIVFNDIKPELVEKGLASYAELGIKAHGYVCDVTDEAQVQDLVARIEKEVGVIDILVNNAGIIKERSASAPRLLSRSEFPAADVPAPRPGRSTLLRLSPDSR